MQKTFYINTADIKGDLGELVITLGNFDGFHLGHLELMKKTRELATLNNIKSAIFTFFPHPKSVILNETTKTIYNQKEKLYIANNLGIDYFIDYPFTLDLARTTPFDFVHKILKNDLNCKYLVIGEDYTFGANKAGNAKTLVKICDEIGIQVHIIPHLLQSDKKISSSRIINLIGESNFTEISNLMGRPYLVMGEITSDFPIIRVNNNKILPKSGVYCVTVDVNNTIYEANATITDGNNIELSFLNAETLLAKTMSTKDLIIYFIKNSSKTIDI